MLEFRGGGSLQRTWFFDAKIWIFTAPGQKHDTVKMAQTGPNNEVIEHLKLIQAIITRMNASCSAVKGFGLAIFSALIAAGLKERIGALFALTHIVLIALASLDGFYLWQERLFKRLYDEVRLSPTTDFSMNRDRFKQDETFLNCFKSVSILPLYLVLILMNCILFFYGMYSF